MSDRTTPNIGKLIGPNVQRDAIHIAVAPMTAIEDLQPGEHVAMVGPDKIGRDGTKVGIVDPYLRRPVTEGQRCYLFLYPLTITGLRHEWTHPAFDSGVEVSRGWIEQYAAASGQTYDGMMRAADIWVEDEEYTYDNSESYKDGPYYDQIGEFWKHYEIVRGVKVKDHESSFYTCSC